ncbi:hypothetical protein AMS68_002646 [Peltaster fructicola]|uniref:Histidinol-phosphatase n=1 Tax=Peltaster fructicola TaxID=286661 RepID=A0A6H0XR73_9PEZI|nr:hypothetical protein AMS68_002646 [Peltaster fructicola]
MTFSHHSHSGQFCGHAANTLEEVVQNAISKGMHTFCMTEHIPREIIDFYPEETDVHTETSLAQLFDDFYNEAHRLKKKYEQQIALFIGFEGEWIRHSSLGIIQGLLARYPVDMFVGSIHHMHTIPIDYDADMYHRARNVSGGRDEQLYDDYFDEQLRMLQALKPPIIGHMDLIRLKSDDAERSFKTWPETWSRIIRNLRYIADYGGVLELNSSSIRKGMSEPYPKTEICREFHAMGGRFTLSDDSHGIVHVGLNFSPTLAKAREAGITHLCHVVRSSTDHGLSPLPGFPHLFWKTVSIEDVVRGLPNN